MGRRQKAGRERCPGLREQLAQWLRGREDLTYSGSRASPLRWERGVGDRGGVSIPAFRRGLRGPDETSVKGVLHARVHDIARQWYFFSFSGLKWLGHWDSGNSLCSFSILLPHCFSQGVPPLLLSAPKEGGYKKQILRKDHSSIA